MLNLLGEYEATIDSKGRFLIPGGLKKQLPDGESRLVISRGIEKCLTLYPIKSWEPIVARIRLLNDFDPKVREFKRLFLGGATEVELDSAGRLLLPQQLKEYADLSKDIVLAADLDKINIWDASKYKQFFEDFSPEVFSNLAATVMANKSTNDIGN
ncbi:MAG TPA: division/cell wall cluster transcriptional repressor MraZ [Chitinophagaceae bacterium]|nr:division/cell wall cluster transcriptional repressor MraZ [Chitinophagaceae bacterium]MCC6634823.1 division/cell wall cluster transcriptional repressor MraZ [Chitinophagaceae bacterium]HMZ45795.1 division/cell wall cluster transcriptional repressor MraZ [Chitinophagaceae bacterium]HNM34308.1 division/cell wall cluster transcriptional repressor MraZ [Chitinophagaceae bacterium]